MKKKRILKILAGIAAFVLTAAVFLTANAFLGNPVSASRAKQKASAYINTEYGHLNLEIKEVVYNLKDSSYIISVYSKTSEDTHFILGYRGGEIINDYYELSVLSGMNTLDRFCDEYKKILTPLVQAKTKGVTGLSVVPEKPDKYGIALDKPFDKKLIQDVTLIITCVGGVDAKYLSDMLLATCGVMKENGYAAAKFTVTSQYETALTELSNIRPAHIEDENLEEILQKAITDGEYDGIVSFRKGHK